jgi:hypothetical protein
MQKNLPDFLVLLGWLHATALVSVTFTLTVAHLLVMFTNCCLYPFCFPTYLKASEWHSAYQNTGKSPPPLLCASGPPLLTHERRVTFQRKDFFKIKPFRCFRFYLRSMQITVNYPQLALNSLCWMLRAVLNLAWDPFRHSSATQLTTQCGANLKQKKQEHHTCCNVGNCCVSVTDSLRGIFSMSCLNKMNA